MEPAFIPRRSYLQCRDQEEGEHGLCSLKGSLGAQTTYTPHPHHPHHPQPARPKAFRGGDTSLPSPHALLSGKMTWMDD